MQGIKLTFHIASKSFRDISEIFQLKSETFHESCKTYLQHF